MFRYITGAEKTQGANTLESIQHRNYRRISIGYVPNESLHDDFFGDQTTKNLWGKFAPGKWDRKKIQLRK